MDNNIFFLHSTSLSCRQNSCWTLQTEVLLFNLHFPNHTNYRHKKNNETLTSLFCRADVTERTQVIKLNRDMYHMLNQTGFIFWLSLTEHQSYSMSAYFSQNNLSAVMYKIVTLQINLSIDSVSHGEISLLNRKWTHLLYAAYHSFFLYGSSIDLTVIMFI